MLAPISAFIITKNEEVRLPRTIAALQSWVEEIIVVDSGSTDRTAAVARALGAKVIHRDWNGYGDQKRFAERQCRNQWLLNVDADEVVTADLAEEICSMFRGKAPPAPAAYRLRILTVYPGDDRPRPFADDYNVVRLYHKAVGSYRDHPIFDRVVLKNTTPKQLTKPVFHYSYTSFAHIIDKNNQFSSFRTESIPPRSRSYLLFRLGIEFPFSFFKSYILRGHLTGGWKGFYFSLCQAFMRTTSVAKMLERTSRIDKNQAAAPVSASPPALKRVANPGVSEKHGLAKAGLRSGFRTNPMLKAKTNR